MSENDEFLVTCDNCSATSEAGWGDHPTCLDCTPADEVCPTHQRTFYGSCDLCPTWSKPCERCGETVERYRGEGDVFCSCGALYNAGGQRLRDDAPAFGVHGYWGPTPYDDDDY